MNTMEETQNQTQEQIPAQAQEQPPHSEQPGMYQSELHRAPAADDAAAADDDGTSAPDFLSGIRRSVWED